MADNPWERIARSQRLAAGLLADALGRLVDMGKTGVTRPEEALREMAAMAAALGELAGSTAKPLEAFLESQRRLAETLEAYSTLQRQLADLTQKAAQNQTMVVEALEMMTGPVVGLAQRLRQDERDREH